MEIHGHCDSRFERIRSAFIDNFEQREEIGASVALVLENELVVDLWGGYTDAVKTRPWQRDTLVNVWSLGKAITALTLLKLMDTGALTVDDRIATYWPEFAAHGKGDVTFATAMAHRAGLCAIEDPLPKDAFLHWDVMATALANQKPWWEPGSNHGYHTNTLGFLLGEPIRRITGRGINHYLQNHVAGPLGVDFHMGVREQDLARCADLIHSPRPPQARQVLPENPDMNDPMTRMRYFIYNNPSLGNYNFNSAEWRMAEFPSTSPQSNARSIATVFGELADILASKRGGIVSYELLARAAEIASDGEDLNVQRPTRFGLGFQLTQPDRPLGPNEGTFGHYGNGGHLGFADPAIPLGFAYHMNHHGYAWRDPRNIALTDAVYASL